MTGAAGSHSLHAASRGASGWAKMGRRDVDSYLVVLSFTVLFSIFLERLGKAASHVTSMFGFRMF